MPKDRSTPMYKVWARDHELEEDAAEYGAISTEDAARIHADYNFSKKEWYELTWPLVFIVVTPHRNRFAVSVEMETVPEFSPAKALSLAADSFPGRVHIWSGGAMCKDPRLPDHPPTRKDDDTWPEGHDILIFDKVTEEKLKDNVCVACETKYHAHKEFLADVNKRSEELYPHINPSERPECKDNSPPWFQGRWRDWHRGHGCNKDDGKPQSEDARVEIQAQLGGAR